jgi:hypothetical protein
MGEHINAAEKSPYIVQHLIETLVPMNGRVLGLFDGLGWTAVGAAATGRTAFTIEIDPKQMVTASERVSDRFFT